MKELSQDLLTGMNPEQAKAVKKTEGPLLIWQAQDLGKHAS